MGTPARIWHWVRNQGRLTTEAVGPESWTLLQVRRASEYFHVSIPFTQTEDTFPTPPWTVIWLLLHGPWGGDWPSLEETLVLVKLLLLLY